MIWIGYSEGMTRPLRIQYPGAFYHVTCRGNERKEIFRVHDDRRAFLDKLALSAQIYNVTVHAYVLMPNHFHLLLSTPEGNLSEFMRHLNISYTSAFNRRHKREGHLYQGRYKSFLIDADDYLLEVSRYIHLYQIRLKKFEKKPVKERLAALQGFKASSFAGYCNVRKREDSVDYGTVLEYVGGDTRQGRQAYRKFVQEGIGLEVENPLEIGKGNGIVGEESFVAWVKERFLGKEGSARERPSLRALRRAYKPEELIDLFCSVTGKEKEGICRRGKGGIERSMLMELLHRYSGISQVEIGKLVGGIDYSAVSIARKRLQSKLQEEPGIRRRFDDICDKITKK